MPASKLGNMSASEQIDTNSFTITADEEEKRIDKLLTERFESKSRTYFQFLIEEGYVLVNGKKIKKRNMVKEGDEVEIFFCLTPEISLEPEDIPLDILYEDDHLIAVNKPPGMVVHPAPGNWSKTFVNALLSHCKNLIIAEDNIRPGIVHRLDKDTSGILLAAKSTLAHQRLISAFSERRIQKKYLAITLGKPQNGLLSAPIGRHPKKRKEMTVIDTGKEAISDIQILAYNEKIALVLIKPKTGRTHQIRVHLKHLNAPVLGDAVYGNTSSFDVKRQLLHAFRLEFEHPITKDKMELVAPIPDDMKELISTQFHSLSKNNVE